MWVRVQARVLVAKPLCSGVTRGSAPGEKSKTFILFSFNLQICILFIFLTMKTILDDLFLVINQKFLIIPLIPRRICISRPYYLKTYPTYPSFCALLGQFTNLHC